MKKLILILGLIVMSCSSNHKDDPLIVPPDFNEVPDLNNPEKTDDQQGADVEKLKDLLLKSE